MGGLIAIASCCFPGIHAIMGIALLIGGLVQGNPASHGAAIAGGIMALVFVTALLLVWAFVACVIISGRKLANRKNRVFSLVIAAILCAFAPLGTALGIFTIIVLVKEPIKELYAIEDIPDAQILAETKE